MIFGLARLTIAVLALVASIWGAAKRKQTVQYTGQAVAFIVLVSVLIYPGL